VNESLRDLECWKSLFRQMEDLGDFRRGNHFGELSQVRQEQLRLCASRSSGHEQKYFWSGSVGGKMQARNLPIGPELEKAEREVAGYRTFLRLSQKLAEVNDRICQLRPARTIEDENELEQLKKNCGGPSPRSERRNRPPHWTRAAGSPAAGTPGPGSQRNGDPRGHCIRWAASYWKSF
jgi:hypothetical protein